MMRGYYPNQMYRDMEPVSQQMMYPPMRSQSLAKLNRMPPNFNIYEKVNVNQQRQFLSSRPQKLSRQQSYDENAIRNMMQQQYVRNPDGNHSDERFFDQIYATTGGRSESSKNSKNNKEKNKETGKKNKENKENKRNTLNISSVAMALIGSLAKSKDSVYESVEQIHYRKTVESMNRKEKVRDIHRTGHPLFDHLREERAIKSKPCRKTSTGNSPGYSPSSSGDEQEATLRRISTAGGRLYQTREEVYKNPRKVSVGAGPVNWKAGSSGSDSDDDWAIPRPKIGGRRQENRSGSNDESDSSSKSSAMR